MLDYSCFYKEASVKEVDPKWHKEQIDRYAEENSFYEKYAETLQKILKKAAKTYAPLAIVESRAKTISSFAEKAVRRWPSLENPVNQMTDLCGARVITQTQSEVNRIGEFIRDNFIIDEENSDDKKDSLAPTQFGYLSVHFIVELPPGAKTRNYGCAVTQGDW